MEIKPKVDIVNIVASTSIGDNINLEDVSMILEDSEYEPEQFPGLICHIDNPKAAALIFRSGKVVCTGTKSVEMVKSAIKEIIRRLKEGNIKVNDNFEITTQNIVAAGDLGVKLNLDTISATLTDTEYEPEQFPGLVYRMKDPNVVILIFTSGKLVCTGARETEECTRAVNKLADQLLEVGVI